MKYIFTCIFFLALCGFGHNAYAQSYLNDVSVNTIDQTVSARFYKNVLIANHPDVDFGENISMQLTNDTGGMKEIITFDPVQLQSNDIVSLTDLPLKENYSYNRDTGTFQNAMGVRYDRFVITWADTTGVFYQDDGFFLRNVSMISEPNTNTGTGGPLTGPIPEVTVFWKVPVIKNTIPGDNSGIWYYEIESVGNVTKSVDEDVYLVLQKINTQNAQITQTLVLAEYSKGQGSVFPVTYPPCVNVLNCPQVKNSPIEPGYDYTVFFSSSNVAPTPIVHSDAGDGLLRLPAVPHNITNASGYITVTNAGFVTDESNAVSVTVNGDILQTVTGYYKISVKAVDTDGSRQDFSYDFGVVPAYRGPYTAPLQLPIDATYDDYRVQISYNNKIIHEQGIGSYRDPVENTGGGSLFGGYTDTQKEILDSGIVPTDCGYGIGPKGNGRMCGFADAITLIQNVIEYIFILILPIAAIVFAYAGFLLLSSGGNSSKRDAAKKAMVNVVIGIVVILLAWLLVKTILVSLGASDGFTMFLDIRN